MGKIISCMTFMLCLLLAVARLNAETEIINIYDANGNLVTGDGRYYEYNDANQLVKVRQGEDQTGPVIAEYFYDSSGQRVKKVENGVVTYYVGKHFEKQVGGSNPGSTSYYFGEGGERVAKKDPAGSIFYYHLDHLDGVNAVTDSAGTLVARTDYLPFGDLRAGNSGTEKYSYTGKEKDKTDLYYFNARYNSPQFRHFTQADIAEPDYADPQDLNRYAYVGNNPLSYVDYDGFKKKKKKKAKLSKREKWMISHGVDPDHDKTPLKKAKAQLKAGTKYTLPTQSVTIAKSTSRNVSSNIYSLANGIGQNNNDFSTVHHLSETTKARLKKSSENLRTLAESFVDYCGSGFTEPIVPDRLLGLDLTKACKSHDKGYAEHKNKFLTDYKLGSDIINDNPDHPHLAKLIGGYYTWGVILLGGFAYDSSYNCGDLIVHGGNGSCSDIHNQN